jgi:hypothetical protein
MAKMDFPYVLVTVKLYLVMQNLSTRKDEAQEKLKRCRYKNWREDRPLKPLQIIIFLFYFSNMKITAIATSNLILRTQFFYWTPLFFLRSSTLNKLTQKKLHFCCLWNSVVIVRLLIKIVNTKLITFH